MLPSHAALRLYRHGTGNHADRDSETIQVEQQYEETKTPARVFTEFFYATEKTWGRERRVAAKAEHLDKGSNPRFVVTSLSPEQMAAQELYEKVYCARGECPENRIKEQQLDLFAERKERKRTGVIYRHLAL